jgi:membrane protease YdiL (CAAX protease family)
MAARAPGIGHNGARAVCLMRARASTPPMLEGPGWPAWTAPVALAAGMGFVVLTPPVVTALAHALGVASAAPHDPAGLTVAIELAREFCLAVVAVGLAWHFSRARRPPAARRSLRPTSWAGAVVGIAMLLIATVALGGALQKVSGSPHPNSGFSQVGSTDSLPYALDILTVIAFAPICEELLFRGYLFTALRCRIGVARAALLTGLCWGALHLPAYSPLQCAPLAVFGVGLCIVYWRTGSLLPCMIAHGLNNAAAYAAGDHFTPGQRTVLLVAAPIVILAVMQLLSHSQTVTTLATVPRRSPTAPARQAAP